MSNETMASLDDLLNALSQNIKEEDLIYAATTSQIVSFLLKERFKQKLTQKEFAKKLNIQQSVISRWEQGNNNFTIKTLSKVAATFDLDLYVNFSQHREITRINNGKYLAISTSPPNSNYKSTPKIMSNKSNQIQSIKNN